MADFKFTGHPQAALTASLAGAGVVIQPPGLRKYITIFDVLASEATLLRERTEEGAVIAYIPSGACNLAASVTGGFIGETGNSIYSSAGNVTITYNIQDANWL